MKISSTGLQMSPLTFSTERLQLAIFLHATSKIRFSHCEPGESGKLRFVFDDPEHIAEDLELEFDRGAEVPATCLFASQKFLRRKMTEAIESRKYGKLYERHP